VSDALADQVVPDAGREVQHMRVGPAGAVGGHPGEVALGREPGEVAGVLVAHRLEGGEVADDRVVAGPEALDELAGGRHVAVDRGELGLVPGPVPDVVDRGEMAEQRERADAPVEVDVEVAQR